jgi:phage tail sheath gpL-like
MLTSAAFSQIPISMLTPGVYVEIDPSRAMRGLPVRRHRALIVGQRLAAGTAAAGQVKLINSAAEGVAFFGKSSQLAQMIAAFRQVDDYTELYALAADDAGAGAAASGTLTYTGPATAAGTIELYIHGKNVEVGVAAADTATAIATATAAAINADTELMVTAAAAAGVVTLTAKHKGELGNAIDVRHSFWPGEALPAGVTLAIVDMSGGTTDPTATSLIAAIADERYDTIVWGWTSAASLATLKTELARRFTALVANDSLAHAAARGTVSDLQAIGALHNSPHLSIADAGNEPTPPWIKAAQIAARDAFEPDPARPRMRLSLPGVMAPAREKRRRQNERETLLAAGISTTTAGDDGTVLTETLITTYKINIAGASDRSYLYIETMRNLAYLRWSYPTRINQRYPRHKLAKDDHPGSPTIARCKDLRSEIIALAVEWFNAGLIDDLEAFKASLQVELDESDTERANVLMRPDLINGFRRNAVLLQFLV